MSSHRARAMLRAAGLVILAVGIISPIVPRPAHALVIQTYTIDDPVGNPSIFTSLYSVGIAPSDAGATFDSHWFLSSADSGAPNDLSAMATWTVLSLNETILSLKVEITNLTDAAFQAAIVSFGFGVEPNATASIVPGQVFDSAGTPANQNFPGGFKKIDVCAFAANNCQGGNINDGLQSGGNSDLFTLNLSGAFGTDPFVTLMAFPIKFQTSAGSYEFPNQTTPGVSVPEPASITVLALGLVGLGLALRGRRQRGSGASSTTAIANAS